MNLPRWDKDSPILHDHLNMLAEAIERALGISVDSSSGLQITENGGGLTIGMVPQRVGIYATVTSQITAMSGTTFGVGQIDVGYKDDDGNYQSYGGPTRRLLQQHVRSHRRGLDHSVQVDRWGLGDRRAELRWFLMFKKQNPGCCCGGCNAFITYTTDCTPVGYKPPSLHITVTDQGGNNVPSVSVTNPNAFPIVDGDTYTVRVYEPTGRYDCTYTQPLHCQGATVFQCPAKYTDVYCTGGWGPCLNDPLDPTHGRVFDITTTGTADNGTLLAPNTTDNPGLFGLRFRITSFPCNITIKGTADGMTDGTITLTATDCRITTYTPNNAPQLNGIMTVINMPGAASGCGCNPQFPGANYPLPNCTITYSGDINGSSTTDQSGTCIVSVGPAQQTSIYQQIPVTVTYEHPRLQTVVQNYISDPCNFSYVGACLSVPKDDYACGCCPVPLKKTLNATICGYACTLTWTNGLWIGTVIINANSFPDPVTGQDANGRDIRNIPPQTSDGPVCVKISFNGCYLQASYLGVTFEDGREPTPLQLPCNFDSFVPGNYEGAVGFLFPDNGGLGTTTSYNGYGLTCYPFMFSEQTSNPLFPGTGVVTE